LNLVTKKVINFGFKTKLACFQKISKTGNFYNWSKDSKNENYPFIPIPND